MQEISFALITTTPKARKTTLAQSGLHRWSHSTMRAKYATIELVREPVYKLMHGIKDLVLYAHVVVKLQTRVVFFFGEGKRWNEFAEWHVA